MVGKSILVVFGVGGVVVGNYNNLFLFEFLFAGFAEYGNKNIR
jgi:hypothetical protein